MPKCRNCEYDPQEELNSVSKRWNHKRIQISIGVSVISLLIVSLAVLGANNWNLPDIFDVTSPNPGQSLLILLSIINLVFISGGYLLGAFYPDDLGDAFTVIDLGFIAAWCTTFSQGMAGLYGIPIFFRIWDGYRKKQSNTLKGWPLVGQVLLFSFFWIATLLLALGDYKQTAHWFYSLDKIQLNKFGISFLIGAGLAIVAFWVFRNMLEEVNND